MNRDEGSRELARLDALKNNVQRDLRDGRVTRDQADSSLRDIANKAAMITKSIWRK